MQVFVGNPTQQHRELHYRVPLNKTARVVRIAAGGQEMLPDDLSGNDLNAVIAQLERLGAVPANDVRAIILPKGLVYEVAPKPIKVEKLEEGLKLDEAARQEVSGQKMEEAGLEAFRNAGPNALETSVEITEMTDRGPVKKGVDFEVVVSAKTERRTRAGTKRVEKKS